MKSIPKRKGLSLRAKSTLLIEGLVVTIVLVTGIITTMREKETLEGELEKRGLALTVDLAKFALRPLLSGDLPALRRFVKHSMEQDYVSYVILLDPQRKVVMHSDLAQVGKIFNDALTIAAVHSNGAGCTQRGAWAGQRHCDIFAPIKILDSRLGTVRLGYSYQAVEKEIAALQKQIFLIGLVTAVIGGLIAYLLAGFIASPIKRITDAIGKVADGNLDTELLINRGDEVGDLARSFNKMIEDLKKTTISKDYVDNIIGSMNDTLIVVDPDGKIKNVNNATCKLLGYKEDELVGKDIKLLVDGKKAVFRVEHKQRSPEREPRFNHEVNYITNQGKPVPMLLSEAVLRDKAGTVIGIAGLARDIEERKRSEEALRESERRLRFLSTQLLAVQEEERRRLSAELHDELGQALVLFKMNLRGIQRSLEVDQAEQKQECEDLIGYINEVSENVRRLSRDLSPAILEDLGLLAAIRRLVEEFDKHSHIRISCDMTDIEGLLPKEAQIIAYRIVQECLTNIIKHAKARNVSLMVTKQAGQIVFRVEDDGSGFNVDKVLRAESIEKGLGLPAMLERARMLKGAVEIRSKQGSGTIVICTIPNEIRGD